MNFSLTSFDPLISIIFGVLVLIFPKSLNYLVAFYLIISGLIGIGILTIR